MNDSSTRDLLLEAAEESFAAAGFDGASVRDITGRAGANLGAVSYHFGSKASLFDAVLLRAQTGLLNAIRRAVEVPGTPAERLERVVRAHFGYLHDHPRVRRLVLQVLLSDGKVPEESAERLRHAIGLVASLVAEGQKAGLFREGDPGLLALSVMTQPLMLNLMRPMLRRGPGIDLDNTAVRRRVLDHALRFVRAGLLRPGRGKGT